MNTFNDALAEYDSEDDHGKHRLIYLYYGLTNKF
jgi:hypothetical protein